MSVMSKGDVQAFLGHRRPAQQEIAKALRTMVLAEVRGVSEGLRFGALAYYWDGVPFGSIGGNVCMIEVRRDASVRLSFVHGAELEDPEGVLQGSGKAKRYVEIASVQEARSPTLRRLVRCAAALTGPAR